MKGYILLLASIFAISSLRAQEHFTHADTLRGTISPERSWWDVTNYDLHVKVNLEDSSITGYNTISYRVLKTATRMQIDLQQPMLVDSMVQNHKPVSYTRDGNAFFATLTAPQVKGKVEALTIYYHGVPRKAKHAPWDGGFVWTRDSLQRPFIATACQGAGASIWWPTKDHQADEPDSMQVAVTIPSDLIDVSNGRLRKKEDNGDGTTTFYWAVVNPINNYDIALNIAHYANFTDTYNGLKGKLDLSFWPLDYNLERARAEFAGAKPMLSCFEHWFGPYPFYEDSYKLVETPHLGMEHQSAVAYGNKYQMGYLGRDLSGTGWGLKFDFILVHESGHEWFGNSITSKDLADMWIHESFTNYSETLYLQCQFGIDAANAYLQGIRKNIRNDETIIPAYNVNAEGSGDMYYKGANMIHTIRQVINNDETFRGILNGLQKTFYHQTVTTKQVEDYISKHGGHDFSKVFDQYLRTTKVPVLEYKLEGNKLYYHWNNVVAGFAMPVKVTLQPGAYSFIYPSATAWKMAPTNIKDTADFKIEPNFYVKSADLTSHDLKTHEAGN